VAVQLAPWLAAGGATWYVLALAGAPGALSGAFAAKMLMTPATVEPPQHADDEARQALAAIRIARRLYRKGRTRATFALSASSPAASVASTVTRTLGSVPLGRTRTHPSS